MGDINKCFDIPYSCRNNAELMSYSPAIFVWDNIKKNRRKLLIHICMNFLKALKVVSNVK